ncbi:ImmA/IrrE family metallo-endopeptidase [bacterium]|nr:ImmA/IrrE family metallo-endopeptidase [bacterium]
MADRVAGMNPKVLKWAREQTAYSVDEVAKKLKKKVRVIESWESGESAPTYVQLETLAYRVYKRPIALFFFPEPPDEPDPKKSFRTLPESEIEGLFPDTRYAIRQARAMQIALKELNDGTNPAERKVFRDVSVNPATPVIDAAANLREYLAVNLQQQMGWKSSEDALKSWRKIVEEAGVFVFKRPFKQTGVSGLCLHDDEFPVIYLNNSTAKARQIFTLFHELAHVLLRTGGMTMRDDRYVRSLTGGEKQIEVFCNRLTATFLVPPDDFKHHLKRRTWRDEAFEKLANRYKVSRVVILRNLLDRELVSRGDYDKKVGQWAKEYKDRPKPAGGNYYATQATYLGDTFLNLAFGRYYEGRCTVQQLADYLNVKVRSVAGLEQQMLTKVSP